MYSLFSMPTNEFVRMDRVSPVVPGLSGSKNKRTTSARLAYLIIDIRAIMLINLDNIIFSKEGNVVHIIVIMKCKSVTHNNLEV